MKKRTLKIKTIEDWRKTISILFDMGYIWCTERKEYYEEYFESNPHINLVTSQERLLMYCSKNQEGDLCDIVPYCLSNEVHYKIVEKKPSKKQWEIRPSIYNEKGLVKFSAYDKESKNYIVVLYVIDYKKNKLIKSVNVDFILKDNGYSLMNYSFDSDGSIQIQA